MICDAILIRYDCWFGIGVSLDQFEIGYESVGAIVEGVKQILFCCRFVCVCKL